MSDIDLQNGFGDHFDQLPDDTLESFHVGSVRAAISAAEARGREAGIREALRYLLDRSNGTPAENALAESIALRDLLPPSQPPQPRTAVDDYIDDRRRSPEFAATMDAELARQREGVVDHGDGTYSVPSARSVFSQRREGAANTVCPVCKKPRLVHPLQVVCVECQLAPQPDVARQPAPQQPAVCEFAGGKYNAAGYLAGWHSPECRCHIDGVIR